MELLYEIRTFILDEGKTISTYYTGDHTFLSLQKIFSKHDFELEVIETLEIYLDHNWVEKNAIEAINNEAFMKTPLNELFDDYGAYDFFKEVESSYVTF